MNIDVRYYKGTYTVNSVLSPASSSSDWILLGTFENVQLTKRYKYKWPINTTIYRVIRYTRYNI